MSNTSIIKTIFIDSSPENVWLYLTDKEKLGEWFHVADVNLDAGSEYQLLGDEGNKICWGRVLEANAPHKLVYTFTHTPLEGIESTVIWELSPTHGGTLLKLTHEGLDNAPSDRLQMLISHDKGWDDHFGRLREKAGK